MPAKRFNSFSCVGVVGYTVMRKVLYLSGTRADFGLLASTLQLANNAETLDVSICVTGTHLLEEFGNTVELIKEQGLKISGTIPVLLTGQSGDEQARALGIILSKFTEILGIERPDVVLVLGDRGEMLVAALAALHMNIPIVHIHGGERSGTIDESIRHAISKLSHYHFVANQAAKQRLIKMGEKEEHIFETGAPGLDDVYKLSCLDRSTLCKQLDFSPEEKIALLVYHPVVQELDELEKQMEIILKAISRFSLQILCLMPNADAGAHFIKKTIEKFTFELKMRTRVNLERRTFLSWMNSADLMLGNSSAGIIEAASYGLPVVNIGSRQNLRERNHNIIDVDIDETQIISGITKALELKRFACKNTYGDGNASERIVRLLETLPFNKALLKKANCY